ncbi:hypothetical protein [Herbiconiux liangxiaofengii]|uniref:hypothetical protein n=1 Tax=Herbiconiux liangxiaofengii TaxID=3342795 RepID=UPI0035B75C61
MELTAAEEYDAFGPWVDEVTDAGQVPRLFRSHSFDLSATSIVLKIPRDIVRRDANPSMHLYDALVIVDARQTTVLERQGATFSTLSVAHDSLVAITNSSDLLDGRFELVVDDGAAVSLRYNGSSQPTLERLMRVLRELSRPAGVARAAAHPFPVAGSTRALDRDAQDYGLLSEWDAVLAREPGLAPGFDRVVGYRSRAVAPIAGGLTRALHRVRPMRLQGAIVGETPAEVHLVHRRAWLHRSSKEDISIAHTVILRGSGAAYEITAHPAYEGVDVVRVLAGRGAVELAMPADASTPNRARADRSRTRRSRAAPGRGRTASS